MAEMGSPHHPLLAYRAVRYLATIGVAPRWIDACLLLVTAAFVFGGMLLPVMAMVSGNLLLLVAAVPFWIGTGVMYWWSNHFKHKKAVSVGDDLDTTAAVLPAAPVAPVLAPPPTQVLRAIPVEPPPIVAKKPQRSLAIVLPTTLNEYLPSDA